MDEFMPCGAEELGIRERELESLVRVRNLLDSGCLKHEADPSRSDPDAFNLQYTHRTDGCGTVACIGGWMGIEMGVSAHDYVTRDRSEALYSLFFLPPTEEHVYSLVTTRMAVQAIDNFLETGNPDWERILST